MKKLLLLICISALILSSCNNDVNSTGEIEDIITDKIAVTSEVGTNENMHTETDINSDVPRAEAEANDDMPAPFEDDGSDSGGDGNLEFYVPIKNNLGSINSRFKALVDHTEYENWMEKNNTKANETADISEFVNMYSFIIHFNIPDETVRNELVALREFRMSHNFPTDSYFSDEEIDILLSKDSEKIAQAFASKNSIVKKENIYSLNWIYQNSTVDYEEAGITAQDIQGILPLYDEFSLTPNAKSALNNKLNSFVAE